MVSRLATFLSTMALLTAASAAGQERLSLQQAVTAALNNNPDLKAARAGEREAGARVEEARAGYLPRVDYVEAWQRGNNPVYVFGSLLTQQRFTAANFSLEALNHPDALTNYHGAFTVDQPIYDSGRLAGIRSAGLGRAIASQNLAEAASDIRLGVTRAYGGVLQAMANRRAAEAAVEAAKDDLTRTEQRRDVGMVTEADVLSLRVYLAQMQERQIRSASAEQIARAQLNRLMGWPLDRPFEVEEPAPGTPTATAAAEAEAFALQNRPAVKRADLQVSLAEAGRSAAKAAFLPQVGVQGIYEINGNTFGDRASSWLIAGQARVNLFAGLGDRARLRAAAEASARAAGDRESVRAGIQLEARNARAELDAAIARESVGRTAVLQARESQRMIRDRYQSGLAGVTDVLRATTALLDAESQRISAIVDVMVGQAALDRAMGRTE